MWTDEAIAEVLNHLRTQQSDDGTFEAKTCAQGVGSSVWESVSSFANTSGGTLLLGIQEKDTSRPNKEWFRPVKEFNANRAIDQFTEDVGDGNPQGAKLTNPPTYHISRCQENGNPFIVIDIDENPIGQKPCYITAKGPSSGGYRRVDDKDVKLSPTDVFEFENDLTPSRADRQVVPDADISDLNDDAVNHLLAMYKDSRALRGTTSRQEQLVRLNVLDKQGDVLLAGLLAAGQYPQQYFPKLVIDVAVHPELEKSSATGPRFLDRAICDGNMPEAIDQAVTTVARNLRATTFVVGAGAKTDSEIPREVLREVIANAVIHREYDTRFIGTSVTVDVYPDRVEVSNPGGLWGGVTLDTIASGESRCRNETLVKLMHEVPYGAGGMVTVEGGGTGIPLVIREMKSRALGAPRFIARPDRFTVILNRYGAEYQANQTRALSTTLRTVLDAVSPLEPRNIHDISRETGKNLGTVRKALRSLINQGLVTATAPPTSKNREYLRASEEQHLR